jgi:RNA polymerase sigma-70 factor (ECF subfamily)
VSEEVERWFRSTARADIPPVCVREWLGEVVRSHYRLLYSIAYGYCRDATSAEDLVQNAVLSGLKNLPRLREPMAVLGWLATITRNGCLQALRRHQTSESLDEAADFIASKVTGADHLDDGMLLLKAISKLPEKLGFVVRMRFLEERDIEEIAMPAKSSTKHG